MKVHELLAEPSRWTQGAFAKDEYGAPVSELSSDACKWCLTGAITKIYGPQQAYGIGWPPSNPTVGDLVYTKVARRIGGALSIWNDEDNRTHSEVLALCRELDI